MIICRNCQEIFTYKKRRGRPPVKCDFCKTGRAKPITLTSSNNIEIPKTSPKLGRTVTIKPREWFGVPISAYRGVLLRWEEDKNGPYAIISTSSGKVRTARLNQIEGN